MKRYILATLLATSVTIPCLAQDSLWVKYDNRFKANRFVTSIADYDSIEFRASTNTTPVPILRRHKDGTYKDYRLTAHRSSSATLDSSHGNPPPAMQTTTTTT